MEQRNLIGLIVGIVVVVIVLAIIVGVIIYFVKKNKKADEGKPDEKTSKESFSKTMLTNASKNARTKGIQENYSDVKVQNSDDRIKAILNRWV